MSGSGVEIKKILTISAPPFSTTFTLVRSFLSLSLLFILLGLKWLDFAIPSLFGTISRACLVF
jgi:hypothetical protein